MFSQKLTPLSQINWKRAAKMALVCAALLATSACLPSEEGERFSFLFGMTPTPTISEFAVTPFPTRPSYSPGELVDYEAQSGDTIPALAAHFNTSEEEIMAANPIIPESVTTLPPGLPMQIPIYFRPLWGSPYQILPDSQYVNGPSVQGFDTARFLADEEGWIKEYTAWASGQYRTGAEVIDYVAGNYSISPRILLALAEYQAQAASETTLAAEKERYLLGYEEVYSRGFLLQLVWAANTLNNGYYGWRTGSLIEFEHPDGRIERPDPWQNAATVALQYYFSKVLPAEEYQYAIGPEGFAQTYETLFGDPWEADEAHIPGSLEQPVFRLPFGPGKTWTFTGGPHTGWGEGQPLAALDFAPSVSGCTTSEDWATAVAEGVILRSDSGIVVLDLDGDYDIRTGWVIFHLHLATEGRVPKGVRVQAGDPLGHPSCEGGRTTGSHVHMARLYNGEWIAADGPLAFVMEGWTPHNGGEPYEGTLTRFEKTVEACACSDLASEITAQEESEGE